MMSNQTTLRRSRRTCKWEPSKAGLAITAKISGNEANIDNSTDTYELECDSNYECVNWLNVWYHGENGISDKSSRSRYHTSIVNRYTGVDYFYIWDLQSYLSVH